jgi:hypothetical protein
MRYNGRIETLTSFAFARADKLIFEKFELLKDMVSKVFLFDQI